MQERVYLCIDLKSFYASVECVERNLDPMTTNLVVADPERSEKTICLAVSPSLKKLGVPGRCRIFQIPKGLDYLVAPPRMQLYINYSANIYAVYLKYIAKEDIFVYSVDEAFLDVTNYLSLYRMSAYELALRIMEDIRQTTGTIAACGIGTNLYLCKIALDITAKHASDNISYLDEELYQKTLWDHRPITDFWRIGSGTARRLRDRGILTMRDIAHTEEAYLYKLLGIDAEILIDHAWGREPTTLAQIKAYQPKSHSLSSGQVLMRNYTYDEGLLIIKEMADLLCLDLVDRKLVSQSLFLYAGYTDGSPDKKSANGTRKMNVTTNSAKIITEQFLCLYERIVPREAMIKRVYIGCNDVIDEELEQYDLFTNPQEIEKDRKVQQAVIRIKNKFGNNSIVKGMDLQKGATTMERNRQIGGHKSGI